eukprot:10014834-Alexandrium_andersonii.AAC.1
MECEGVFGLRVRATDHGLHTDCGLSPNWALECIAGSGFIPRPGDICIRPGFNIAKFFKQS